MNLMWRNSQGRMLLLEGNHGFGSCCTTIYTLAVLKNSSNQLFLLDRLSKNILCRIYYNQPNNHTVTSFVTSVIYVRYFAAQLQFRFQLLKPESQRENFSEDSETGGETAHAHA
jgi:hypothetical protein